MLPGPRALAQAQEFRIISGPSSFPSRAQGLSGCPPATSGTSYPRVSVAEGPAAAGTQGSEEAAPTPAPTAAVPGAPSGRARLVVGGQGEVPPCEPPGLVFLPPEAAPENKASGCEGPEGLSIHTTLGVCGRRPCSSLGLGTDPRLLRAGSSLEGQLGEGRRHRAPGAGRSASRPFLGLAVGGGVLAPIVVASGYLLAGSAASPALTYPPVQWACGSRGPWGTQAARPSCLRLESCKGSHPGGLGAPRSHLRVPAAQQPVPQGPAPRPLAAMLVPRPLSPQFLLTLQELLIRLIVPRAPCRRLTVSVLLEDQTARCLPAGVLRHQMNTVRFAVKLALASSQAPACAAALPAPAARSHCCRGLLPPPEGHAQVSGPSSPGPAPCPWPPQPPAPGPGSLGLADSSPFLATVPRPASLPGDP